MPGIIREICQKKGIAYQSFSDDWVLKLEKNSVIRWAIGYKFDLNLSAAGYVAQDKVATYMVLAAAGIPVVEHYLVRMLPGNPNQWQIEVPDLTGKPVVLKPLSGTGGRAVNCYETVAKAVETAQQTAEPAWTISPYYDLQTEYRLVMLDGEVLLSLEKTQPVQYDGLKLFNLGQGAVAVDIPNPSLLGRLTVMASQTMQALSLRLAAVDIVQTLEGDLRILEVNDGIMLESYVLQSAEYKKRAVTVYEAVVQALFV